MSVNYSQKGLLHIYKAAAEISDVAYRNILAEHAGVKSSADPDMTQSGFERVMAALEALLFLRVANGEVENPLGGRYAKIQSEDYWRKKLPRAGMINSRQRHRIDELWRELKESLPPEAATSDYLYGIVRRAAARDNAYPLNLTAAEAVFVIDALQDCLTRAWRARRHNREAVAC